MFEVGTENTNGICILVKCKFIEPGNSYKKYSYLMKGTIALDP